MAVDAHMTRTAPSPRRRRSFDRKGRLALIERLELMASAGLHIDSALRHVRNGLGPRQKRSLEEASELVASGQTLANSLGATAGLPSAIIGLIACGESSGSLHGALKSAHSLLEQEDELIRKCLSALAYPLVIGVASILLTTGIVMFVMPQVVPLLESLQGDLPFMTRAVMGASAFAASYGLYAAAGSAAVSALAALAYRRSVAFRGFAQALLLRSPIAGGLVKRYAWSVFLSSFGSLVEAGMPADEAYERSAGAIDWIQLKIRQQEGAARVSRGEKVGDALPDDMPGFISALVSAGEASGRLGASLVRSSEVLDRETGSSLKRLAALLEPAMMAAMGCVVGAVALSIITPIYGISDAIQSA